VEGKTNSACVSLPNEDPLPAKNQVLPMEMTATLERDFIHTHENDMDKAPDYRSCWARALRIPGRGGEVGVFIGALDCGGGNGI